MLVNYSFLQILAVMMHIGHCPNTKVNSNVRELGLGSCYDGITYYMPRRPSGIMHIGHFLYKKGNSIRLESQSGQLIRDLCNYM